MKLNITKKHEAELTELREELVAALEHVSVNFSKHKRLDDLRETLSVEIEDLESAEDSDSRKVVSELVIKRTQLQEVMNKISLAANAEPGVEISAQIRMCNLMQRFASVSLAAILPDLNSYVKEITNKVRPYCHDDITALGVAYGTTANHSLFSTYSRRFGSYGFSVRELKDSIARADEILLGELNWSFNPNIQVAKK